MSGNRERIPFFKNYPYLGLFQYPLLATVLRESRSNLNYSNLPVNNPYVGSFNHSVVPKIEISLKRTIGTQTETVHSMVIGEKIIKAYGNDYKILFD